MAIDPRCKASQVAVLDRAEAEHDEPGLPDLFAEYLPARVPVGAVADHIQATFAALLADTDQEEPGIFPEEPWLRSVLGRGARRPAAGGDR